MESDVVYRIIGMFFWVVIPCPVFIVH